MSAPPIEPAPAGSAGAARPTGPAAGEAPLATVYRPAAPLDVRATLGSLRHGNDPTFVVDHAGLWKTAATPAGPATLRLEQVRGEVRAWTWGAGGCWLLDRVPDWLGAGDDLEDFAPAHPLLRDLAARLTGMRMPRTGLVFEALVPAVLEQKVTGKQARLSWRQLVTRFGSPAPGPAPAGMRVCPTAEVWRRIPSWEWHRAGVDGKRSRTVLAAAAVAPVLARTVTLGAYEEVERVLRSVPGVGVWTAAETAQRAHGAADAVSVGDYHIPALVGWSLAGRPVDDDGMLALLAPYRPHRHRVVRLLEAGGVRKPRFGPRATIHDMRRI